MTTRRARKQKSGFAYQNRIKDVCTVSVETADFNGKSIAERQRIGRTRITQRSATRREARCWSCRPIPLLFDPTVCSRLLATEQLLLLQREGGKRA